MEESFEWPQKTSFLPTEVPENGFIRAIDPVIRLLSTQDKMGTATILLIEADSVISHERTFWRR
jgi:hypothetical protein